MALARLPKAFQMVLKNFPKIETSHLGVEVANMNICVPFIFPCIYVSQMVYNWPL